LRDKVPSPCTLLPERHQLIHGPEDTKHWKLGYTGMLLAPRTAGSATASAVRDIPPYCFSASTAQPQGQWIWNPSETEDIQNIIPKPDSSLPSIFWGYILRPWRRKRYVPPKHL
jgi:hypothetical protein